MEFIRLPAWPPARFSATAFLAAILGLCPSLAAQTGVRVAGDVVVASEAHWRGIVRSDRWVAQPNLFGSIGLAERKLGFLRLRSVSAGLWGNVEFGDRVTPRLQDRDETGVSELNPYLQVTGSVGATDLSVGFTRYFYYGAAEVLANVPDASAPSFQWVARSDNFSTSEVYARLALTGTPVSGSVTWWHDVDQVLGSYFETAATVMFPLVPIPLPPFGLDPVLSAVNLDVVAGWSVNQGLGGGDLPRQHRFAGNGLTHVDLSLSTMVVWSNAVSIEPAFHVQLSRDAATQLVDQMTERDVDLWFGITVAPVIGRER